MSCLSKVLKNNVNCFRLSIESLTHNIYKCSFYLFQKDNNIYYPLKVTIWLDTEATKQDLINLLKRMNVYNLLPVTEKLINKLRKYNYVKDIGLIERVVDHGKKLLVYNRTSEQ